MGKSRQSKRAEADERARRYIEKAMSKKIPREIAYERYLAVLWEGFWQRVQRAGGLPEKSDIKPSDENLLGPGDSTSP
jgi:hypothetical protein